MLCRILGSIKDLGMNFLDKILALTLGALIAGLIGLGYSNYWRLRGVKDAFLLLISQKRGTTGKWSVSAFYEKSKSEIRDAVFRLRPFLKRSKAKELDKLWFQYDEIPFNELTSQPEANWMKSFRDKFGGQFRTPWDVVNFYLDEFCKLAK